MALTKIPSSLLDTSGGLDLSGNITLGDNEQILLGDSSDLRLYHDGTNSYIDDNGDGNLTFRTVNQFQFEKFNTELLMELNADGAVNLYYDNSKKFETSSAGATVTGTLTVTGDLDITGDINSYNVTDLDVTDQTITLGAGQTEANSGGSGIIIDGSNASILWDETTDGWVFNKQIGVNADDCTTASSLSNIVVGEYADASSGIVLRGTTASALNFEDNSSVTAARVYYNHASGYMAFNTEQTERFRIDNVGNLLYNTTGTAGADLSDGGILFRRDSDTYMQIASGTESDTTLLYLYKKSGTGIAITGSLASRVGDLVIGHNAVGLRFSDAGDSILPAQSGTSGDRDDAIDLGASGARFKDGYFSQNVNISNSSGATLNINSNLGAADSKILLHEGTTASPVNGASIRYDGTNNLFKIGVGSNVDTTRLTITRDTGNVGIGTDSPLSKLHVEGKAFIGEGSDVETEFPSSTASLHIHEIVNDANGVDLGNEAHVVISTGVNATGAQGYQGSLWFGTSDHPAAGNTAGTGNQFVWRNAGIASTSGAVDTNTASGYGNLEFFTNNGGSEGTRRMTLTSTGELGIGTDSPQDALHVKNPSSTVGDAQVILEGGAAGYGTGISFQAELTGGSLKEMARIVADGSAAWNTTTTTQDARLRFFTTNDGTEAEKMVIYHDGNVGIGKTAPTHLLHVASTGPASIMIEADTDNATESDVATLHFSQDGGLVTSQIGTNSDNNFEIRHNFSTGNMVFHTNGANERMQIKGSDGTVMINRTSSFGAANSACMIVTGSGKASCAFWTAPNTAGYDIHTFFNGGLGVIGTIEQNSSLNGTNYNTTSDYRLKENINYDWDATTILKQLKPAEYNFISDPNDTYQQGFIAHEVEEHLSFAVSGVKDAIIPATLYEETDQEVIDGEAQVGDIKEEEKIKPQQLDYSKLVPLLVKTIQELEARITELENA